MAQAMYIPTDQTSTPPSEPSIFLTSLQRKVQLHLDQSVPYTITRWIVLSLMVVAYAVRVYLLQGFYIVTYGLGIFVLNLFIGFLTPLDDAESDGPLLPVNSGDEFRPFQRRLSEFKFWLSCTKAMLIGFAMTFISLFNVPVFWPILLIYFIVLFVLTMKRQIKHMIKHRYYPWSWGKKKYAGKAQNDVRAK